MLTLALSLFLQISQAAQFARGRQFEIHSIQGDIEVSCPQSVAVSTCREQFLSPWPYDQFKGPINPGASRVVFEAIVSGADPRQVESAYIGTVGVSEEINLGVAALFQRPLLRHGKNEIKFRLLSRSRRVLEQGQFVVEVIKGKPALCRPQKYQSIYAEDCSLTYSLCQQYFREQKYCGLVQ